MAYNILSRRGRHRMHEIENGNPDANNKGINRAGDKPSRPSRQICKIIKSRYSNRMRSCISG